MNFDFVTKKLYNPFLGRFGSIIVTFESGKQKIFDAVYLGTEWFKMSNDCFFEKYGFNFNIHEINGLYEYCRNIVYKN